MNNDVDLITKEECRNVAIENNTDPRKYYSTE